MPARSTELRREARIHDLEAARLRRQAVRLARRGSCFTAAECSERAVRESAFAAQCRLSAINHEQE